MKTNTKVINKNNYYKRTQRGRKERLDQHRKTHKLEDSSSRRRKKYQENKSVFNPDNPNSMKIATVRARQVIPFSRQKNLSNEKLQEVRMIIVVDTIKDDVLYLNLTSPKTTQQNKSKYFYVDNVLRNSKYPFSVVDIDMDKNDYSLRKLANLNIKNIKIQDTAKLTYKSKIAIQKAVDRRLKNLKLSKKMKKTTI